MWVEITGPLEALRGLGAIPGVSSLSRGARRVDPDGESDLWTVSATLDSTDPIPAIEARGATVTIVKTDAEIRALLEQEWRERPGRSDEPVG
jgi:hypothetical protein